MIKKIIGKRKQKRAMKNRNYMIDLMGKMTEECRPLGVTELKKIGVVCPLSSLYELMDRLVERELSRPADQRLIEVFKTEDRVATRYSLTEKGKMMGYWLALRKRKANQ